MGLAGGFSQSREETSRGWPIEEGKLRRWPQGHGGVVMVRGRGFSQRRGDRRVFFDDGFGWTGFR
jgi:hypothetical protein